MHITSTQWCKFMSKNQKFSLESRAGGEGKLARRRNIKSASFHAHSDSEIYTTELQFLLQQAIDSKGCQTFQELKGSQVSSWALSVLILDHAQTHCSWDAVHSPGNMGGSHHATTCTRKFSFRRVWTVFHSRLSCGRNSQPVNNR